MIEEWREVVGYPGYEVSDMGRVRSWKTKGNWRAKRENPLIMKLGMCQRYIKVTLSKDGKRRSKRVHRMVLVAFQGVAPGKPEGCHTNGDCRDNRLSNLRWDTRAGNLADNIRNGVSAGHRGAAKLTESQVLAIRTDNRPLSAIAESYSIGVNHASNIKTRRRWARLPEQKLA